MKILSMIFQRNGVASEPFYQCVYRTKERGFKKEMLFVATFRTSMENGIEKQYIDRRTCRVTSVTMPQQAWRGDVIADDLNDYFIKTYHPDNTDGNTFYDLIIKVNKL